MSRTTIASLLVLLGLTTSAAAQEPDPTPPRMPCAATDQLLLDSRLHLACGSRYVVIDLASGQTVTDQDMGEPIRGLHQMGERLWIELGEGHARLAPGTGAVQGGDAAPAENPETTTVESGTAIGAVAVPPPPAAEPEPTAETPSASAETLPRGRVLAVEDDVVLIDLGRADGIDVGQRIDVTPTREGGSWLDEEDAIVGRVENVTDDRARVRIRWGQSTEVDAPAVRTETGEVGSRVAPPALPRGLSVRGALLAGLPIDDLGIQTLVEGELTYRARRFFMARARLRPSGLSIGKGNDFGTAGGYAQVGFDHRLVGAAFGIGLERVFEPARSEWDRELGRTVMVGDDTFSTWVAFPTSFRIGATDGLMVEVTTSLTIDDGELAILAVDGMAQIPLANGVWLQFRGGGGIASSFWHSEAVVSLALSGNGGPGTTTLQIGAGALGTTYDRTPNVDRVGPSLLVGLCYRL